MRSRRTAGTGPAPDRTPAPVAVNALKFIIIVFYERFRFYCGPRNLDSSQPGHENEVRVVTDARRLLNNIIQ